ncbi:MAG: gliding motility-associated C-terminal domain-containing protein [Bacteroidota bacterium]
MKRLFLVYSFLIPLFAVSQISCVVTPSDTLLCARDSMAFVAQVDSIGPTTFQWLKNGVTIPGATNDTLAIPRVMEVDTGAYHCIATLGTAIDTSNISFLRIHPVMNIFTLSRINEIGCRLTRNDDGSYSPNCKAQFVVGVAGGNRPLSYVWGGGYMQDSLVLGLCPDRNYTVKITDPHGCMVDSTFFVDYLKTPDVPFIKYLRDYNSIRDTFYLTNPNVTVKFPDEYLDSLVSWVWRFGDGDTIPNLNPATHAYDKNGEFLITLKVTDLNDCDTTIQDSVIIRTALLKIPYAFTPNGDGKNDKFEIKILRDADPASTNYDNLEFQDAFLGNEFVVFNRAGKKVYDAVNYKSGDWDGRNLPDGVYFYILKCQGQYADEVYRGAIHILGRGF